MDARRSKIISDVLVEWSAEQRGKFEPAAEWATNTPSAYPEHAELLSSSPDAEADLFARTEAALAAAGFSKEKVE